MHGVGESTGLRAGTARVLYSETSPRVGA